MANSSPDLPSRAQDSAILPTGRLTREEAVAALQILVNDLPPQARGRAVSELLEVVAQGYDLSGKPRPAWVAEVLRELVAPMEPAPAAARRTARGRYRGLLSSTEEFLRSKREELDAEQLGAA
ncbi:MAG TPA: hypothetical protein VFQ45_00765 [Longimicrobium sp.]|nr:hypothetical protein [Longimicrobium sp.]